MRSRTFALRAIASSVLLSALVTGGVSCKASSGKNAGAPADDALKPRVVFAEGTVSVTRAEQDAKGSPLLTGELLSVGDSIRTGPDGTCEFELPGIGMFGLGPDSRATIDAHLFEKRRGAVSLEAGRITSKIERLGGKDSFILRTPSIVCGVRGTIFTTSLRPDGELSLRVSEGSVSVFPDALLTHTLHPATGFLRPETDGNDPAMWENETARALVDALPTVIAGQEIVITAKTMSEALPDIERVAASLSANSDSPEANARASELLEGIKGFIPEPSAIAEPAAVEAPPDPQRDGYEHSSVTIPEPANGDTVGDIWFRPYQARVKTAKRKALVPMSDENAFIATNQAKAGAKGAFEKGRARLTVESQDPFEWLALVSSNKPHSLARGALYLAECTAWTEKGAMQATFSVSEGAEDRNGDGEAYKPYLCYFLVADPEPRRFSFLYCHTDNADPGARLSVSTGATQGTMFIQDMTLTKLSDVTPSGPEPRTALIPNGTFSRGFLFWEPLFWANAPREGIAIEEGRARYDSRAVPPEPWHVQLGTTVALKKGARYALTFDMRSTASGKLGVELFENDRDLNKDGNTLSPNAPYMKVEVAPNEWQRHTLRFTAIESDPKSRLCFSLGDLPGTTHLDNVTMTEER